MRLGVSEIYEQAWSMVFKAVSSLRFKEKSKKSEEAPCPRVSLTFAGFGLRLSVLVVKVFSNSKANKGLIASPGFEYEPGLEFDNRKNSDPGSFLNSEVEEGTNMILRETPGISTLRTILLGLFLRDCSIS